ncbi:MAG TPA: nuclear transport factor 2 family protein [Salegentibacter sp.]|uniref:nuclear transport factor 2 family protein n=1 Tax=Salegentibacter sp. TaxID=1903072 RepID=UPI002F92C589
MKKLFLIGLFLMGQSVWSQNADKKDLRTYIETFFEAFHLQDTVKLRSFAHPDIVLQSISVSEEGVSKLTTDSYSGFLKGISSIPETTNFEEELLDFEISVYGKMAHVSTPYSFYLDGEFSHCGVNSFQLMQVEDQWKIIYLVDTRKKTGCQKN